jgi:hypothetical protein
MLPFDQGYRLFQSIRFKNVLLKVQRRFCAVSKSEEIGSQASVRTAQSWSGRPSVFTVQASIRPNVSETRPDAFQSSRRI